MTELQRKRRARYGKVTCSICGTDAPSLFHHSCRVRSRWTAAQRARFEVVDRRSEAMEQAPWRAMGLEIAQKEMTK